MNSFSGKIMCFAISILILMVIAPMAFGSSETIVLGRYEVSFDLNTPLNHTIEVQPPLVGENDTNYGAYIKFTNQTRILMGIDVSKNARDSTFEPELKYVRCLASGDENATVATMLVDNQIGIQTASVSKSGYPTFTFRSWLDSEKCDCGDVYAGTTKLEIIGVVPINISENLLNTLHVASLTSMPDQFNAEKNDVVQVSGKQGTAIAKEMKPMQPLNARPNVLSDKLDHENAWLESIYPADPASIYLHEWANYLET